MDSKQPKTVSLCGGNQCCPILTLFDDGSAILREGPWALHLTAEQVALIRESLLPTKDKE